jgi:hypothetical protein
MIPNEEDIHKADDLLIFTVESLPGATELRKEVERV